MPKVNPEVLRWARGASGLSVEEAAGQLKLTSSRGTSPAQKLAELEQGVTEPSASLIKRMAAAYRRPLLAFYMPKPPAESSSLPDFRSMPGADPAADGLLATLIRKTRVRQAILREALEDAEEADRLPFVGSMERGVGVKAVAESITQVLGFEREAFRKGDYTRAFAYLRELVEEHGVVVLLASDLGSHHTRIPERVFRGFALSDAAAPFIVINDTDAKAAYSFTLLHELAHLWIGEPGISDYSFGHSTEVFCNRVAAAVLLDTQELAELDGVALLPIGELTDRIHAFARARNISGAMVAYALLRHKQLTPDRWSEVLGELRDRWARHRTALKKKNAGAPDWYTVRRYAVGKGLLRRVERLLRSDALTTARAGRVLGVTPQNVGRTLEGVR